MGDRSPTDDNNDQEAEPMAPGRLHRADDLDPLSEDSDGGFDDSGFEDETVDPRLLEAFLRDTADLPVIDEPAESTSSVAEWLDEWEDVRPRSTKPARQTRKLPPFARQEPPRSHREPPVVPRRNRPDAEGGAPDAAAAPSAEKPGRPKPPDTPTGRGDGPSRTSADSPAATSKPSANARRTAKVPRPPLVRSESPRRSSESAPSDSDRPQGKPTASDVSGRQPATKKTTTPPAMLRPSSTPIPFKTPAGPPDDVEDDRSFPSAAVQTNSRSVRLGGFDLTIGATRRSLMVAGATAIAVVVAALGYLLLGVTGETGSAFRDPSTATVIAGEDGDLAASSDSPPVQTTAELAMATVQIVGLDDGGEAVCAGSGVLVGSEGIILTNAHVITVEEGCEFTSVGIAVTHDTSDPPNLLYMAETLVTDDELDLAVLRIAGPLSQEEGLEIPPNFPTAVLGDSDEVELGDEIRILGYPVIGGVTITSTSGSVSGFSSQLGIGSRALIKTDAAISAGNSGGMALNEAGEVIGIPTRARATESGPAVDCRPLSDTNADGEINNDDNCVPVGGFLNGIRPINLAQDLLARAEAIEQARSQRSPGSGTVDISTIGIGNVRFSTGVDEDNPVDEVMSVVEGVEQICLFVDWEGIPNGVAWAAVWSLDGTQIEEFGIYDGTWEFGESGRNFWYCADDPKGHAAGTYEIGFFVDHQLAFVEAIEITEDPVPLHDVTWVNKTDEDLCALAVNPLAVGRHAGVNELDPGEIIAPEAGTTLTLPAGVVVVEAYNCNGEAIAAELDGLTIPDDMLVDGNQVPFVIGGPSLDEG